MEISMIINCGFLGILLLGFLFGYAKGTFKASFRLIYLAGLFVGIWFAFPAVYAAIEAKLPEDFYEPVLEYITKEEIADLAPFVLRTFLTPYVWLILSIVTLPIYWILCFIFKKILVKKPAKPELSEDRAVRKKQIKEYRKSLKPTSKSRLFGALIGGLTSVSTVFALFLPVTGAYEMLKDDQGTIRCIKVDDFDSCEFTKHYENSAVSKIFSIGNIGEKAFFAISSGEAFGVKSSLGKDLTNFAEIYFLLQKNGIDFNEDIDWTVLLERLDKDEIQLIRNYLVSSKLLMSIIDNVGIRVLDKELNLGEEYSIDITEVTLSKELGIILDVISMLIELPLIEDGKFNKNYIEIINSISDKDVDDLIAKLGESDAVEAIVSQYGKEELAKSLKESLKEYNPDFELDLTDVDLLEELKVVINTARELVSLDIIYFNEEKGKVSMRSIEKLSTIVTAEELDNAIEGLFESEILNKLIDGVATPILVDVLNDSLGKNYTAEELNLDSINWKDELAHDMGLIIDLYNTGIMEVIESGDGNFFTAISDLDTKDQLINDMVSSQLLVGLLDVLAPEYINEFASSMTDDPNYTLDIESLNIDWSVELTSLIDFVEMLDEGGVFEEDFDFIEYIGSLDDTVGNDEIAKLSNSMTSSKIVMEIIPAVAESALSSIGEDFEFEDVEWEDEIEPLLRVIKLFHSYGMFEDGADVTSIVMDVIEDEDNIDIILDSDLMYDMAISTIEDELGAIEVDGESLLDIPSEGLGLTKDEWKSELELLSSILGDIDAVEDIANIGSLDPEIIINQTKLRSLGNMLDTLLQSKIFGEAVTDKLNETLELTGSDVKTNAELRSAYWGEELIAANKILYEVNNVSDVTVDMVAELVETAESTTFVRDLVTTKVKEGLESVEVNGTAAFTQTFIDELDIYTVDWEVESNLLDDLTAFIEDVPAVVDSAYGAELDVVLARGNASKILKPVVERELRTIIKDNITDAYDGDVSFVDELDVFNMSKYGSSFEQEFSMLDSLETIASESYEFSVEDLNAFDEGGVMYNVANSVLAANVLDGSTVTLSVPNQLIKDIAIELINGMTSSVSSLDLTNTRYGKDVIISLIVIE